MEALIQHLAALNSLDAAARNAANQFLQDAFQQSGAHTRRKIQKFIWSAQPQIFARQTIFFKCLRIFLNIWYF